MAFVESGTVTIGYEACAEGVTRWCVSPGEWCGFSSMVAISYQICKVEMARVVYRYAISCKFMLKSNQTMVGA